MIDSEKIKSIDEIASIVNHHSRSDRLKIGFTNGCFDLVHLGHLTYLADSRSDVDCLIVGLNSDNSVSTLKGTSRPINNEMDRALFLSFFHFVDYVLIFDELTPLNVIRRLKPDVLFKGGDYGKHEIVGSNLVKAYGGSVVIKPFKDNCSTSSIINKILNLPHDGSSIL